MTDIHGLKLDLLPDFSVDEVMVSMRGPSVQDLKDPRMLQKQLPVRPSLIVHRRIVGTAAALDMLVGEICAELIGSIQGMENLRTEPFAFDDGAAGTLIVFDFPVSMARVRQFQVARLDGGALTTLTLTVDAVTLTDKLRETYFKALASTRAPSNDNKTIPTL